MSPRYVWTKKEATLMECLMELVSMWGWKSDNGTFRAGQRVSLLRHSPTWGLTSLVGMTDLIWGDRNEEFPSVYSQGIDLSQDDARASRPSRASEGRTGSSGSKRKRRSQREVDIEGIHLGLNQTNEQLRMITEWPTRTLANDNHVCTEFFHILHEILELTSLDRALLQRYLLSRMDNLRGFVLMPENEREGFCKVLLRDMTR
ncbi:retrotransposon protein [Cucumis melo var. makuwa]|uniref:Retrotransposon protein n=1 Tax=Cucumis melo var. makuwa TaxID=1194695 RepID=A0A5A7UZE4_CUCMM|nr:retrotransposon protein [Cucumis melo var. makuwa]